MTPVIQAAAQGYTAHQILNFLSQAYPKINPHIKKAAASGYTTNQILKFINQMMEEETFGEYVTPSEREGKHKEKIDSLGKMILGTGATALGLNQFSQSLPQLAQGLLGNAPQASQQGAIPPGSPMQAQVGPQPMANAPVAPPTLQQGAISQTQQGLAPQQPQEVATANFQQPEFSPQQPPIDSASIIREMKLEPKINNLLKAGNPPEIVGATLDQQLRPGEKKWLDEQIKAGRAKPLPEMVNEYAKTAQNAIGSSIEPQGMSEAKEVKMQRPEKPVKGDLVATQHGLGDLESMRDKQALIKDDSGKLHRVKSSDIIESPLPKKDLADLYDEIISGIERETGEEVSRNVNWAGYDPESNILAYRPHLGALYTYEDISPDDAQQLTSILNKRKSTGENFIGAWTAGTKSPIGAAMSALIRKLQSERGGKGQEYAGKFQTIYDAFGPAAEAAKKKKAEEDKRKKKNERQAH